MGQLNQNRATAHWPLNIVISMFVCLFMCAVSYLSGCMLDYSIKSIDDSAGTNKKNASDGGTDSEGESSTLPTTDGETATETDSESEFIPCPTTLEFEPAIRFTETVVCFKPSQEYTDSCPDGQAIIGFSGFLRDYDHVHARIRAICGLPAVKPVDDKCIVKVSPGGMLPVRGTSGTIEWTRTCPDNQFLMGFKAWIGDNMDKVIFRCAPLLVTREGGHFVVTRGPFTDLEPIAKDDGREQFQQDCSSGHIATTTVLQADTVLRAIGLGCQIPSPR